MVTPYGVKQNIHSQELNTNSLYLEVSFVQIREVADRPAAVSLFHFQVNPHLQTSSHAR